MEKKKLTSANGRPIADNQNTQTAGQRGPIMMQDPWFLEKLAHFDREVIPERRMHAKGSGAYGTFTVTHDITKYTRAAIFSEVGKKTECFVRFSTVAGERGAADAERDIRGFAMKFYTEEEILDKHIGKKGTPKRDQFEADLNSSLIGEAIKQARQSKNLTQEELGNLIGVQRAQISRIENGKNLTFSTIARVFKAMGISAKLEIGSMGKVALW